MVRRTRKPIVALFLGFTMVIGVLLALNVSATETVMPGAVQAGGMALVDAPLSAGDLPDGWSMIALDDGHVAISVPADAEVGEYAIGAAGHWHQVDGAWWCGDDATGEYDDYYYDGLVFEDLAIDETTNTLAINHYMKCENKYDGGNVQISEDDGATWTIIYPADG
ncbi:MAG: hypothetical protein KAT70_00940, partial [Thermoplasmata archaeon]|nr:hypothetical protein [Thermoplasmata archaeon]